MADISQEDLIAKSKRYFGPHVSPVTVEAALADADDPLDLGDARAALAAYETPLPLRADIEANNARPVKVIA